MKIYDQDFSIVDGTIIRDQLVTFGLHVRRVENFIALHDFGSFAIKMIQTKKHFAIHLVTKKPSQFTTCNFLY
jgi:hypothetical protein